MDPFPLGKDKFMVYIFCHLLSKLGDLKAMGAPKVGNDFFLNTMPKNQQPMHPNILNP